MKMIQRIISGLLTLCMVVSMMPMQAFATDGTVATSGTCGDNLTWTFDESTGTLTITGSGAMYDYEFSYDEAENTTPWGHWAIEQAITNVVLDDRITEIGDNAFANTRFYSIDLPNGLTRIGNYAFWSSYLGEIDIPDSVTYIGEDVFAGCYNLERVVLPAGITEIPDGMFYECHFISSVVIPEGVEHIGKEVFYDCSCLEEIILPESLKTIGTEAFRMTMTSSLKTITIPANVTNIGSRALGANSNSIVFEGNAPSLADDVFEYETLVAYYPEGNSTWTADVMKDYGGNVEWKAYTPESDAPHSHSYTAVVTEPDCWNEGYTTYICICGDSYKDNYVDATGHSFGDWYETKAATDDAEGEERRDCANCEYFETQKTDKLTHATHNYTAKVTAPTCTEKGYTTYTCECGNSYVGDYVDATGHDYDDGVVTTAPGCETEGVKTFTCANDKSHTYTEPVAATGHTYSSVVTKPTCTDMGYTTFTCACGNSYVDNYVDPIDHSYTAKIIQSTCTEKGYTTYTCQCGHSYIDGETDPTGHAMEEWCIVTNATCETAGEERRECGKCDYFETRPISATGHSMGELYETKAATIDENGEDRRDCANCEYFETRVTEKLNPSGTCGENLTWTLDENGTLTISGTGEMANYFSNDNKAPWHTYRKSIFSVIINEGVTSIGDYAFYYCNNANSLMIADTVKFIGKRASF